MEKCWMIFFFLVISNIVMLDGKMDFLYLFDCEDDYFFFKFIMKWNKWSESCRFEEEVFNEE